MITFVFTLYFAYILWIYYKKGDVPSAPQNREQQQQVQNNEVQINQNQLRNNGVHQMNKPAENNYNLDENVLEGKHPGGFDNVSF